MEKVIYENGIVDTLNKPFSACWMVFGPNDCCNLIVGDTNKVKSYWESLDDSFDFQWYIFDSKGEMESGIKQITREPAPFITWLLFKVEDCINGSYPNGNLGVDLGNSSE
jgi:hypothetical protein